MKILLLLILSGILISEVTCRKHRSVSAEPAPKNPWPFLVSLRVTWSGFDNAHECAGSLISANWVLTAAHCFDVAWDPNNLKVDICRYSRDGEGENGYERIGVKKIIPHRKYKQGSYDNDIALVELVHPVFPLGKYADHVDVIKDTQQLKDLPEGTCCMVAGWGEASNTKANEGLQLTMVSFISTNSCKQFYPKELTENMICAGYQKGKTDPCKRDSGGPLMCVVKDRMMQVGIASWGFGCGSPNLPGVYTDISKYLEFIKDERVDWKRKIPPYLRPDTCREPVTTTTTSTTTTSSTTTTITTTTKSPSPTTTTKISPTTTAATKSTTNTPEIVVLPAKDILSPTTTSGSNLLILPLNVFFLILLTFI